MHPPSPTPKTIGLTTLAMIAFAANWRLYQAPSPRHSVM
jgi:hypothetical protein